MTKPIIFTDHSDSVLSNYLKDISKFTVYPNKEVIELVKEAQEGNNKSREKVIKSNLRFVVTMAKRYQGRGIPLMDLISEGNSGLLYAIDKFDVNRGVPFISYAVHWIKQYIYQSIYWSGREIRLPVSQQVKVIQLLKAENEFTKSNSRKPSSEELSSLTGISVSDIDFLAQYANKLISVDDFLGGDSENNQVCDIISDGEPPLEDSINKEYLVTELQKILGHLTIREHDIICMLFGIGMDPIDNKQVSSMFGVGTERIRQIKEGALKKLRTKFGKKLNNILR